MPRRSLYTIFGGLVPAKGPQPLGVDTYHGSVGFPLFTGGRMHAEATKADLEIRKIDQEKAWLRGQLALEMKPAWLSWNLGATKWMRPTWAWTLRIVMWHKRGGVLQKAQTSR